jgi:FKBP-type peptidyl-prolyl cis-trans isomerase 2
MKEKIAKQNSRVKIFYHGTTLDNKYLLSNKEHEALEFTIGSGSVPKGLEDKIIGMASGEKREFTLQPEEGFGKRKNKLITTAEKRSFPDQSDPQIGKKYRIKLPDGRIKSAKVTAVEDNQVTLDANHPLAGRTLSIEIEMLEVG